MTTQSLLSVLPTTYSLHSNGSIYNTEGYSDEGTDFSIEIENGVATVSCTGFVETATTVEEVLELIA